MTRPDGHRPIASVTFAFPPAASANPVPALTHFPATGPWIPRPDRELPLLTAPYDRAWLAVSGNVEHRLVAALLQPSVLVLALLTPVEVVPGQRFERLPLGLG